MVDEFELRFKKPEGIENKLAELGFQKKESYKMDDLIFEPVTWESGSGLKPGYFAIRIRLVENKEPLIELKKMIRENLWDEISIMISDPKEALKLFSEITVPRRVISKQREIWIKDNIIISLDDVKHLGKYIEIEGTEKEVMNVIDKLSLKEPQPVYGNTLFYLEKEGKVKFDFSEMEEAVANFKYVEPE